MNEEEQKYDAKEQARMRLQDAVQDYIKAAGEYGHDAAESAQEIADTVWGASEQTIKLVSEDV